MSENIKGYFLFPTYVKKNEALVFTGVMNKMNMQVKELSKWFDTTFLIIYASPSWTKFQHKIINRLFVFSSLKREYDETIEKMDSPDFIYIRKVEADRDYIDFLKMIRRIFPNTTLLVELPTYPYEKEAYKKLISKVSLLKDRHYRKRYKDYIDRFVVLTDDTTVFGVPTINIMNGIDVESQPLIREKEREYRESINFIFVGMMQPQHGLERIIKGLREYNKIEKNKKIKFLFVGCGPEYEKYKSLTSKNRLDDSIVFYGNKTGSELDELYNCADIAICPLGCYKTIPLETRSSALKTREYLARGLPVVTGCVEDVFERFESDFYIEFNNDDSYIDLGCVIDWYQALVSKYGSREVLASEIRKYACKYVDNSFTMKPVIDYIQSKSNKTEE